MSVNGSQVRLEDDAVVLVSALIQEKGLVRLHLDSYNRFIQTEFKRIVEEVGVVEATKGDLRIKITNVYVGRQVYDPFTGKQRVIPEITEPDFVTRPIVPLEARLRGVSYAVPVYCDFEITDGQDQYEEKSVLIGELPVMLKSNICITSGLSKEQLIEIGEDPEDPGGYFIINGSERIVVSQEDLATNHVFVEEGAASSSVLNVSKVSSVTRTANRTNASVELTKDGKLYVYIVRSKFPMGIVLRALGVETDRDMAQLISQDEQIQELLTPSFLEAEQLASTVDEALRYIGNRIMIGFSKSTDPKRRAEEIIAARLLPHLGTANSRDVKSKKAAFIAKMVESLLEANLGRVPPTDKDHYANKRLRLAGDLMGVVVRNAMQNFVKDLRHNIDKSRSRKGRVVVKALVSANLLTDKIQHALATGNWPDGKTGVSQILDRTNYLSTLSHLRRVISPLNRLHANPEARELHMTQWGRICPSETPEGVNCGLVKNLALAAIVSVGMSETEVSKFEDSLYRRHGVKPGPIPEDQSLVSRVYLDGRLIGHHPDASKLVEELRERRRTGGLSVEVSVAVLEVAGRSNVYVSTDAGRVMRPLIIVRQGKSALTPEAVNGLRTGSLRWSDLISKGMIEYLDALEEENALVAMDSETLANSSRPEKYTHLEIAPWAMMGVVASIIPYSDHNQSPRNTYESAMAKQALGLFASNFRLRADTRGHILHYPQKPIVTTSGAKVVGFESRPAGQNVILAVAPFEGYNIEDAVIMNKASVDRGLGRSTFFRMYEASEKKYPGGYMDKISVPDQTVRGYRGAKLYEKLDEDGIISPETEVFGDEVVIGRVSPPRFGQQLREVEVGGVIQQDTSVSLKHSEQGRVDRVTITFDKDGNRLIKVRVRDLRVPELGDKFASRHGQKGVVAYLVPQEDMPFTRDGIVPDIMINPHAFPSRMTVGQLIELMAGKVGSLQTRQVNATPFVGEDAESMKKALKELGFSPAGVESVIDGRTGRRMDAELFIGVVYYQKLHHMVADKIHARSRGNVQITTRQPTEGRAREGGLRFGEMERDVLIGHGAAALLKDRLLDNSDKTTVGVCDLCGHMVYYDFKRAEYICPIDGNKTRVSLVSTPYAFKLLLQELMSMGISPRLKVVEVGER
ncbi:MAG: DNA-directed RNA polymerase subunit B [Thermoprotei archaeon]